MTALRSLALPRCYRYFWTIGVGLMVLLGIAPALAVENTLNVTIHPSSASDPVALVACDQRGPMTVAIRVGNRSDTALTAVTYRLRTYDSQGSRYLDSPLVQSLALDPGEIGVFQSYVNTQPDLRRVVCSVTSATFENGKTWRLGESWHGSLVALTRPTPSSVAEGSHVLAPAIDVRALSLWTTPTTNSTYVHVRAEVMARRNVSISAGEFSLLMPSSGGGERTFPAMSSAQPPAPQTQSPASYLIPAASTLLQRRAKPMVDPDEDFGAAGKLHLHGGELLHTVISFQVTTPIKRDALPHISLTWTPSPYATY